MNAQYIMYKYYIQVFRCMSFMTFDSYDSFSYHLPVIYLCACVRLFYYKPSWTTKLYNPQDSIYECTRFSECKNVVRRRISMWIIIYNTWIFNLLIKRIRRTKETNTIHLFCSFLANTIHVYVIYCPSYYEWYLSCFLVMMQCVQLCTKYYINYRVLICRIYM